METVELKGAGKSRVLVYHFGAHITSWVNAAGREMIYTSPTAVLDGTKAIRGGIPVCFPQFAKNGPLKQHGFARNMIWKLDPSFSPEGKTSGTRLILSDTEETRASEWPHRFEVKLTITLGADGNSLRVTMDVVNSSVDGDPFQFTTALHSYYRCEAEKVTLPGFDSIRYEDKVDPITPGALKTQVGDISFGHEVDRVYLSTADKLSIPQVGLTLVKKNMPEAVIWNPYVDKTASLGDMPDDDWKYFICIEPARVTEPAIVGPGEIWSGELELSCSS